MAATDRNALSITNLSSPLTFDLSVTGTTRKWFLMPPRCDYVSVEASWTSTGTPVGAFTFEAANAPEASSGKTMAITTTTAFVAEQPGHASDTGSFFVDNVQCSANRFCVAYTRTSGGTGATATVYVTFKTRA